MEARARPATDSLLYAFASTARRYKTYRPLLCLQERFPLTSRGLENLFASCWTAKKVVRNALHLYTPRCSLPV